MRDCQGLGPKPSLKRAPCPCISLQLEDVESSIEDVDAKRGKLRPKVQAFKQYQAIASEYLCKRAGVLLKCKIISVCPLMRRLPCRRNNVNGDAGRHIA